MITTRSNVIKHSWVRVERRIDETNGALPNIQSRSIDQSQNTANHWCTSTCSVDVIKGAIDSNNVVNTIGGNIWDTPRLHGRVVSVWAIRWLVLGEVGLDGGGLVEGKGKNIREATAGVDDALCSFFGLGDAAAGFDLSSSDGGDI